MVFYLITLTKINDRNVDVPEFCIAKLLEGNAREEMNMVKIKIKVTNLRTFALIVYAHP